MPNYLDAAHRTEIQALGQSFKSRTEWPTWALLVGVYGLWFTLLLLSKTLGATVTTLALIALVTLWMSLQHEMIHGHPTRWPRVNKVLAYAPFAVWYPYALYRDTHLAHHDDEHLTMPGLDPESRYVNAHDWRQTRAIGRVLKWIDKTLGGRVLLGALLAIGSLVVSAISSLYRLKPSAWAMWSTHGLICAAMLIFIQRYSAISAAHYVLLVSIPALAVSMIRSYHEHRPADAPEHRTVINEDHGPLSWLFLNLNLHLVHHDLPSVPWYHLPRVYQARRAQWLLRNNGYVIKGYGDLLRQHSLTPIDSPCHPHR